VFYHDSTYALNRLFDDSLRDGDCFLGWNGVRRLHRVQSNCPRPKSALKTVSEYRALLDAIADGILILDPMTACIVDANQRAEELYGYDVREMTRMKWGDLSADSFPYSAEEANNRLIRAARQKPQAFQWLEKTRTGRLFWAELHVTEPSGRAGDRVVVTTRDISDRKKVEDELTATKNYLDTVYNSIHDAVFVHDVRGRVTDVNDAMLEMYRCVRREAVGLFIYPDYTTPDGLPDLADIWKSVLEGKNEFLECRGRRPKDGFEFDVEVFLTRLRLSDGDSILATVRDISERKKVERELLATKNYLNTVFNSIHDAVFVHDLDGRVVDVNDKLLDMYKLTREEAIGLHISPDYTSPEGSPDFREIWESVMNGHDTVIEARGRRPNDGHEFDAETFLTRLSLPGGDYILANTHDISVRKSMEKELHAERQRFKTVLESSPVGMVVMDGDKQFRFSYLNPKFKELFGCDLRDTPDIYAWLLRAYPDATIRREATPKWITALQLTIPGSDRSFVRKVTGRGGFQKHVSFVPVRLQTGEILMTCWDITKTREAERRIRERNLILEILNEVMSSVAGSLDLSDIKQAFEGILVQKLQVSAGGIFFEGETDIAAGGVVWGVPVSRRQEFAALAKEVYRNGVVIYDGEIRLVRFYVNGNASEATSASRSFKWLSYLCITLSSRAENPGMVILTEKKPGAFGDDQVAFYATLGQQIGVAIQNARLFEQVQQSHAQMRNLSLRLVRVQEEELRHVGRELHDEVGQLLTGLGLTIEMALQSSGASVAENLLKAKDLAATITGLVRELSRRLRPAMLDDLGLLPTLPWLFERFSSHTNVTVAFEHMIAQSKRFSHEVETAVYRIVQEALTNIARHARIDRATVRLWAKESTLGVQIEDSGIGFDVQSVLNAGNVNGLNGIRERVVLLGGQFTVDTRPGAGTRLTAEFPLKTGEEQQ
jgi:PAS domain S-box-containing protein